MEFLGMACTVPKEKDVDLAVKSLKELGALTMTKTFNSRNPFKHIVDVDAEEPVQAGVSHSVENFYTLCSRRVIFTMFHWKPHLEIQKATPIKAKQSRFERWRVDSNGPTDVLFTTTLVSVTNDLPRLLHGPSWRSDNYGGNKRNPNLERFSSGPISARAECPRFCSG